MSEQFILYQDDFGNYEIRYDDKVFHFLWEVAPILNEQQATINELQSIIYDYCCETVYSLYNEIKHLKEENEQLRENLHNCRLNKNIISEKLKLWQDVHKEYNIYSIKDFEELLNGLKKENEQLRQQIQNYEKLISNSYVGEEETLDGFVGKYVIWENELQKYKNKNGD